MSTSLADHELKLLNLGLIFYVLLGALLFHSLGEFDQSHLQLGPSPSAGVTKITIKSESKLSDDKTTGSALSGSRLNRHLAELRLSSVRRMWNITNRLNILYETNWTELVLAELVDFERRFVESISVSQLGDENADANEIDDDHDDEDDDDNSPGVEIDANEEEQDEKKKKKRDEKNKQDKKSQDELPEAKKRSKRLARLRLKSIKMSLVHSIATVTTMSSPIKSPSSQLGKLATILYGSLGIPLLLFAVTKSGLQVAQWSLNGLLIVRHYCFRLPLYYLGSLCNICLWLRLLSWCCCCCCCSYLICHLFDRRQKRNEAKGSPRGAPGLCGGGRREAPKLKLRPPGGAREPVNTLHQPAYVIGFNQQALDTDDHKKSRREKEGSRSGGQQSTSGYYSASLFLTSLAVLLVYVSAGAFYYSRTQNISLVDATFACYSMLSASKLPDSFHLTSTQHSSLSDLYKSLTSRQNKPAPAPHLRDKLSFESMLRDSMYLLIGLNLISACAQFARLWLNGEAGRRLSGQSYPLHEPSGACNGSALMPTASANNSLAGSFNQQPAPGDQMGSAFSPNNDHFNGRLAGGTHEQLHQHRHTLSVDNSLQSGDRSELIASNKSPEQIDLAELFVVDEQAHEFGIQQSNYAPQAHRRQQQHLLNESAASFGSDRSSDARSLCLHHQAQVQQQQQQQQAAILTGGLYGSGNIATAPGTVCGLTRANAPVYGDGGHLQLSSRDTNDEDEDDAQAEGDLERMLKTCDVQNGLSRPTGRLRVSSSSSQLNMAQSGVDPSRGQQVAPEGQDLDHGHHHHHHYHHNHRQPTFDSNTVGRSRQKGPVMSQAGVLDYTNVFARSNGLSGNSEQVDSSPNTVDTNSTTNNSQTVSSMSSKRATVSFNKSGQSYPPHQTGQLNGTSGDENKQIGFIYRHH